MVYEKRQKQEVRTNKEKNDMVGFPNVEQIELAYLISRYVMFVSFLFATIIWKKNGICYGLVVSILLVGCTAFLYLRYRSTELYRLHHCTNKLLHEKLISYLKECRKPVLNYGKSEKGFYIVDGYQGLLTIYYLPFRNKGSKHFLKIRKLVDDMDDLSKRYDADRSILIMNDYAEQKIRLLQKLYPEYSFEFWNRRTVCRMLCDNRENVNEKDK